jgi:hypothetical protein
MQPLVAKLDPDAAARRKVPRKDFLCQRILELLADGAF